jgi:hypothetical protein
MKAIVFGLLMASTLVQGAPNYKQCDARWGNTLLAQGPKTICQIGCAMTSVAMILADRGVVINGKLVDPGSLNEWMNKNEGYSGNLIIWGSVNDLSSCKYMGKKRSFAEYEEALTVGRAGTDYMILNVKSGGHWVLLQGLNESQEYIVNDPGRNISPNYPKDDTIREAAFYSC